MVRRGLLLLSTLLMLALLAPAAFGAVTDAQQKEIDSLYKQMIELRKQMIQKYVEAGEITPDQAKLMQERMDYMLKNRSQNGFRGLGPGACGGPGAGGPGFGGCGKGFGKGFGGFNRQGTVAQ